MIPSQRHLFDMPDDVAYLNCAYMAPLPRSVVEAGERGLRRKQAPWDITPDDFFDDGERVRALFAQMIGATADDVALTASASYGIAVAAANVPVERGQNLVALSDQFPSNIYSWRELARERGAGLRLVARPADGDWTRAVLGTIDDATAVVALPHCHWTDGSLVDLEQVGRTVQATGGRLVLDVTQSVGALPLDVGRIRPDYLVAATYKWLMGPYGFGLLYVAPRHQSGRPIEHNWITRQGAEDFAGLVRYRDDLAPGARRFDVGERSNFALVPAVLAGMQQVAAWGVESIQETLAARNATIARRAADELGLESIPEARRAGHYLGMRFPGGVPAGLLQRLAEHNVFVSLRGDSMRVTPHVYNTDEDVERLFAALHATAPAGA